LLSDNGIISKEKAKKAKPCFNGNWIQQKIERMFNFSREKEKKYRWLKLVIQHWEERKLFFFTTISISMASCSVFFSSQSKLFLRDYKFVGIILSLKTLSDNDENIYILVFVTFHQCILDRRVQNPDF